MKTFIEQYESNSVIININMLCSKLEIEVNSFEVLNSLSVEQLRDIQDKLIQQYNSKIQEVTE